MGDMEKTKETYTTATGRGFWNTRGGIRRGHSEWDSAPSQGMAMHGIKTHFELSGRQHAARERSAAMIGAWKRMLCCKRLVLDVPGNTLLHS